MAKPLSGSLRAESAHGRNDFWRLYGKGLRRVTMGRRARMQSSRRGCGAARDDMGLDALRVHRGQDERWTLLEGGFIVETIRDVSLFFVV
jgi:hypothetical protein